MEGLHKEVQFPRQRISTGKKGKEWFKKCIDSAINNTVAFYSHEPNRRSRHQKTILRNLSDGKLDPSDIENSTAFADYQNVSSYQKLQNYPLAKPRIDLLVGESSDRRFDWAVRVLNDDSISQKEEQIKDRLFEVLTQALQNPDMTQEELDKEMRKLEKWKRFELQDVRERRASHILTHLYKELNLELIFMQGMDSALVEGEEIYCVDIVSNEPIVRRVNPLNFYTIRSSDSIYAEDCDIIVEDEFKPIGYVIDSFYDELTNADIDYLEKGGSGISDREGIGFTNTYPALPSSMFADDLSSSSEWRDFFGAASNMPFGGAFDTNGNVRVTRVVWRSLRKLGIIERYDENGIPDDEIVDENYEVRPELGEKVRWMWINEWMEGTRVAEDIYLKMQPRPIQFRRMDNLSAGGSGYVGTIYPESLLEILKPYQYLYILVMEQFKKALKAFRPPMVELDFAKVPDDWTLEQWMYYAEQKGWLLIDSFKEGKKGESTGKLAGNFNTTGKSYNNLEMGGYIQQLVVMLQFIERQISVISGVTDQRLGQIENRETVGGVERSVTQSSHITEKLFKLHDNTKLRVLQMLLETAKYTWRNKKSKKVQYVLDDLSTQLFEIDGEQFNESEYGLFVTNSSNDTQLYDTIKSLSMGLIQNDKMNIKDLMTILTSPSISTMRRELEASEDERQQLAQQQFQAQQDATNAQTQARAESEEAQRQLLERNNIRDNETKLLIADKQAQANQEGAEPIPDNATDPIAVEKLRQDREKFDRDLELRKSDLAEKIRHNTATEGISRTAANKKPAAPKR